MGCEFSALPVVRLFGEVFDTKKYVYLTTRRKLLNDESEPGGAVLVAFDEQTRLTTPGIDDG